jgi:hypothetical protein
MNAIKVVETAMRETGNGATHELYDGYCILYRVWRYLRTTGQDVRMQWE